MKKKAICLFMVGLLFVGAAMPKKAYAFAGVDDAAVAIVLALLGAAGITFATNDGVQDAVQDFLSSSGGKYDSTLERLYDAGVTGGGLTCFKIPVSMWASVKVLLEGLFEYFSVDENRQGAVSISSVSDILSLPYVMDASTPAAKSFFGLELSSDAPVFVFAECTLNSNGSPSDVMSYSLISLSSFSGSYFSKYYNKRFDIDSRSFFSSRWISSDVSRVKIFIHEGLIEDDFLSKPCFSDLFRLSASNVFLHDSCSNYFQECSQFSSFLSLFLGGVSSEKSLPYGLTFPEDMTAPDVIDNFEQKVKEGAGDTAIAIPADGVIDSTLPWADAWEKYLVNVNEVGEIGDTVTETNTWLGKILTEVKAIPAKIAALLESLLMKLFYPSDAVLSSGFDGLMAAFKQKTDAQTYLDLLSRFKSLQEPDLADITINWNGNTYVVLTWDFFRRTKATYSRWLRGFLYLFLLLFNFNNIYKLIRNASVFDGSGHGSVNSSNKRGGK